MIEAYNSIGISANLGAAMSHTYLALAFTVIASLFYHHRLLIIIFILITGRLAIYQGFLDFYGAIALVTVAILTYTSFAVNTINQRLKFFMQGALAFLLGELMLHHVPGFNNPTILNKVFVSDLSRHYTMYFSLDKVFSALILYTGSNLILNEKAIDFKSLKITIYTLFVCILVILTPTLIAGYIKFDPKIPTILPTWAINNLLFVCFSEEVIYRGFLQSTFIHTLPNKPKYAYLAIFTTAVIFGLFHFRDGLAYMALAAIAGLFYGYVYYRTNRISCAMLVHFLLNFTHLMLFTYPSAL